MQRDSTEGEGEGEAEAEAELMGEKELHDMRKAARGAEGGEEDEDTTEDEKDEVEVVLEAIAEAQRRRLHPNNTDGGDEEEVRVMGSGGSEDDDAEQREGGEPPPQQHLQRRRPLRRFPSFEGLGRRSFACVRHLLLDANHLPSIPDDIGRTFPCLEGLVLTNEAMLSDLPPLLFAYLTRLQSLSIMKTSLATLPLSVSHLSSLRILQLSSNRLTALPHSIGNLPSLAQLYCSDNQLTSLPPTIFRLTSLQILFVDNNRLTALPSSITALPCTRHSFTFSVANNLFHLNQDAEALARSVSSLLDLCLGTVATTSATNRASLADMLPRELVAKLDREARRRFPHRLAEQNVVLESVYCSSRCASTTPPDNITSAPPPRPGLARGSESMEDLPS